MSHEREKTRASGTQREEKVAEGGEGGREGEVEKTAMMKLETAMNMQQEEWGWGEEGGMCLQPSRC